MLTALLGAVLLAAPPGPSPELSRLAEAFAEAVVRAAAERPIEILAAVDRTDRGGTLGADFEALVQERLSTRSDSPAAASRARLQPVLAESGDRLVASARIIAEPEEQLIDIISASIDASAPVAPSASAAQGLTASPGSAFEVVQATRAFPLLSNVSAVALLDADRLVLLSDDALALYRWDNTALVELGREPLPGPLLPTRSPAGLMVLVENESALWVLGSRSPAAVLYGVEPAGLVKRLEAQAIPFPAAPEGLRYRPGTNLIEGPLPGLGDGPFAAVAGDGLAVSSDGALRRTGRAESELEPMRVGTALATVGALTFASSPVPPGGSDLLTLIRPQDASPRSLASVPIDGTIRALAARQHRGGLYLVAAVQPRELPGYLLALELAPREP